MTTSNNYTNNKSMYLQMLESIEAKGELFKSLYNEETRRYELLCFAMYMYDCSFYFNDMLLRWKEHLPHLGEAQDVEFLVWKDKIRKAIEKSLNPINEDLSYIFTEQEKNLCEEEIAGLYAIYKGTGDFKRKIEDMSQYLLEHNANIEQLVIDVGYILAEILGDLDNSLLYADAYKYEDLYKMLSNVWEPNWPALKHDEYDTFVQRYTPRVLIKNIKKRIEELLSQFITNQFEPRWQALINCSSDWDDIFDSKTKTIDTQAIGRYAIAHRREEGFNSTTLPTLLAFVRLVTFMQEQAKKIEAIQQKPIAPPDSLKESMAEKDFYKIENSPNYYAPTIHLQKLLKQDWFKEVRTNEMYNSKWTDNFVSDLMATQWKIDIAQDWAVTGEREKKNQIKGYILGLLKDTGVLDGSYDSIAVKVGIMEDSRSFSNYMSQGKKQPYSDWVKSYVTGLREE